MRVIIAGGGTGGHLFPGIALAEEILRRQGNDVLFVGTDRGLEATLVPKQGYALRTIDVSGLKGKGVGEVVRGLLRLPRALAQSRRILRDYAADLVVGVGGYSSGPMVLAAALARLPTAILEQNSIPGVTNRILGRSARRAFIAFERSRAFFPRATTELCGNPIRTQLSSLSAAGVPSGKPTLLVVGGSLGAHALNELVAGALETMARDGRPMPSLIHQTGEPDRAPIEARYRALGLGDADAQVRAFIDDMASAYAGADLVVCRAGATTIAELAAIGLPALFIPFPFATDDHQFENARALAEAGGAIVHRQSEITASELARELRALLPDHERLARMRAQMRALGRPEAARAIVDVLEKMVTHVPRA